jgi:hypothetical protein
LSGSPSSSSKEQAVSDAKDAHEEVDRDHDELFQKDADEANLEENEKANDTDDEPHNLQELHEGRMLHRIVSDDGDNNPICHDQLLVILPHGCFFLKRIIFLENADLALPATV